MKSRSKKLSIALLALCTIVLTGCAKSSDQYGVFKPDGVFLKVPATWHRISQAALDAREAKATDSVSVTRAQAVKWQLAFSPNGKITAADVLSLKAPTSPLVFVRVRSLLPEEVDAVSYNSLRNIIVPLTTWASGTDSTAPEFQLYDDAEIVQKIARGIHNIYEFTPKGGTSQTIDQTALVSDDRSTIFVLIVRCTTTCFAKNMALINKITQSFTVRGNR